MLALAAAVLAVPGAAVLALLPMWPVDETRFEQLRLELG